MKHPNDEEAVVSASDLISTIGIRNVLLVHLLVIVLAPGYALQAHQELSKIWKTLRTALVIRQSRAPRSRFWEIDMTKFEP